MTLRLYDTYSRTIRDFEPLNSAEVGVYTCGPTVYNYAHIGNLRTYLFEDLLRRALEFNGYSVKHVANITDVGHLVSDADEGEDKMEKGSRQSGKTAWEIAEIYTEAFKADFAHLNILEPTIWCRATEHIDEQIAMIQRIEEKDFTYRTSDGIYFDTSKLDNYGYLARLDIEGLRAGSRVDIGEKRNVTDFALWKFSPDDEKRQMEWDSPWGTGCPGWHIECSAMSTKYLGRFFDIHCGGEDHISVHHSNEIAQTQACYGTNLANFWLHGYFLQLNDKRMAKSSGEFLRLQTLIDRGCDPLVYRYFCLTAHYRSHLSFSWETLDGAAKALQRLRSMAYEWGAAGEVDESRLEKFTEYVNNDLNVPRALALSWDLAKSDLTASVKKATLCKFDEVLGLKLAEWEPSEERIPDDIVVLAEQRQQARVEKRWQEADQLRDRIAAAGYDVKDTPQGPEIRMKK
ncbi:MAG: cysteine--tRNA ligase [bacterium]|nr:cysteine--tRNA ligase [bacterium]